MHTSLTANIPHFVLLDVLVVSSLDLSSHLGEGAGSSPQFPQTLALHLALNLVFNKYMNECFPIDFYLLDSFEKVWSINTDHMASSGFVYIVSIFCFLEFNSPCKHNI